MPIPTASLVDGFDQTIVDMRSFVRERMPFTFIAYRSFVPDRGDDWYYLAEKVAWVVFVVVQLVEFAASLSLWIASIPFIPFALDALWLSYRSMSGHHDCQISPRLMKVIQCVGFTMFGALGVAFLFDKMRVLTLSTEKSWFRGHMS